MQYIFLSIQDNFGLLGLIFTIVAIIVSILIAYYQKSRKSITYKICKNVDFAIIRGVNKSLDFVYLGVNIKDKFITSITITCNGNQTILVEDIIQELGFYTENEHKNKIVIQCCKIIELFPTHIDKNNPVNTHIEDNVVRIDKFLINPNEYVKLLIVTDEKVKNVIPIGRIAGITEFKQLEESLDGELFAFSAIIVFMAMIIYIIGIAVLEKDFKIPETVKGIGLIGVILITFISFVAGASAYESQFKFKNNK